MSLIASMSNPATALFIRTMEVPEDFQESYFVSTHKDKVVLQFMTNAGLETDKYEYRVFDTRLSLSPISDKRPVGFREMDYKTRPGHCDISPELPGDAKFTYHGTFTSPSGNHVATLCTRARTISFASRGRTTMTRHRPNLGSMADYDSFIFHWSPDERHCVVATTTTIEFWEVESGTMTRRFDPQTPSIMDMVITPAGDGIVLYLPDKSSLDVYPFFLSPNRGEEKRYDSDEEADDSDEEADDSDEEADDSDEEADAQPSQS